MAQSFVKKDDDRDDEGMSLNYVEIILDSSPKNVALIILKFRSKFHFNFFLCLSFVDFNCLSNHSFSRSVCLLLLRSKMMAYFVKYISDLGEFGFNRC